METIGLLDMKRVFRRILLYVILILGAVVMGGPLLWMLLAVSKTAAEVNSFPPTFLPKALRLDNVIEVFRFIPLHRYFLTSLFVGTLATLAVLFFSSLGGYVFGKLEFPGRDFMFMAILSTMMIPFTVRLIPLYLFATKLGVLDSYVGLLLPELMTGFGVFMMRQFMTSIPNDLMDSARIDGCSEFGIYYRIIVPQLKPALGALAIFTFMWNWDSFMWPLVMVNSEAMRTIPLGLALFSGEWSSRTELLLTASSLAVIPVLIVFLFAEKQIIEGITLTGIKG